MTVLGLLGLGALFALLALRMPVALSMLAVGFVGTAVATANRFIIIGMDADKAWTRGWKTAYSNLSGEAFEAQNMSVGPVPCHLFRLLVLFLLSLNYRAGWVNEMHFSSLSLFLFSVMR